MKNIEINANGYFEAVKKLEMATKITDETIASIFVCNEVATIGKEEYMCTETNDGTFEFCATEALFNCVVEEEEALITRRVREADEISKKFDLGTVEDSVLYGLATAPSKLVSDEVFKTVLLLYYSGANDTHCVTNHYLYKIGKKKYFVLSDESSEIMSKKEVELMFY